jgi:predicted MFS family arabinose efflux permease
VCYALHALTLAQLFAVTFGAGALSIVFTVSDGTLFVSIVAPERYMDAQSLIYGARPLGAVLGGLLGSALGRRPALWIATLGGVAGFALLLPTPLPRYRLPVVDGPART